jgi:hypothetical protein
MIRDVFVRHKRGRKRARRPRHRRRQIWSDELSRLQRDPANWAMQARNYAGWRYTPLDQINRTNVKDLKIGWQVLTGVVRGHEGACRRRQDRDHFVRRIANEFAVRPPPTGRVSCSPLRRSASTSYSFCGGRRADNTNNILALAFRIADRLSCHLMLVIADSCWIMADLYANMMPISVNMLR